MYIHISKEERNFAKIRSKVTGYEYGIIALEIDRRNKVVSYQINNQGRIEWWDAKRFEVIDKIVTIKKRYYTRCNCCGEYIPCDVIEEIRVG